MTDDRLLERLQAGDESALAVLSQRYESYICTVLRRVICDRGSRSDVEELCADVIYAVWRSAGSIGRGKLRAYLGVTARNRAKSWLRTQRELPMDLDEIELPDPADPLEEQVLQKELAQKVRRAVDSLRPKDRDIFLRYYYYLQPAERIAAELGIPAATVRSRLARGRERLKKYLCEEDV